MPTSKTNPTNTTIQVEPSAPAAPADKPNFRIKKKKEYTDYKGDIVPGRWIDAKDAAKQHICEKYVTRAKKISQMLIDFRDDVVQSLNQYKEWEMATYGIVPGKTGSRSVTSFDGKMRVELDSHADVIYTDTSIEIAKELMGKVIDAGTGGVTEALRKLFMDAFTPSKRSFGLASITMLMQYKIPDPRWEQAVEVLNKGRQLTGCAFYIQISVRNEQNQWESIPLSISKVKAKTLPTSKKSDSKV